MDAYGWIFWAVTETIKYIVITYAILGFSIRKGIWKYSIVLYIVIGIPLLVTFYMDTLLFKTLWGLFLLAAFFEEKIETKAQAFALEYLLISMIDVFFWSLCINIVTEKDLLKFSDLCNICGLIFWILLSMILKKEKKNIYYCFTHLSRGHFFIILLIFCGLGVMLGYFQFTLSEEPLSNMKKILFLFESFVSLLVISGCIVNIYTFYAKKEIELISKYQTLYINRQQKFYEDILQKDQRMRQFRHDMQKHMLAIKVLCEREKIDELKKYVEVLYEEHKENNIVYTGNVIADCFIGLIIERLKGNKNFAYVIIGKFPETVRINNNDMCVLIANALDNAYNALKKISGKKRLEIEIKNYDEKLFIKIANSVIKEKEQSLVKKEVEHGMGITNMKHVIEKYGGEIDFFYEQEMFVVKIFL